MKLMKDHLKISTLQWKFAHDHISCDTFFLKKRRTFRKFTYRGVDLDQLLDMNNEQLMELF